MKPRHVALITMAVASFVAAPAWADTAGLQLNPLQYEDTLTTTAIKTGHIDVANPGDTSVAVVTHVKGFRQTDLEGHLAFFEDPKLTAGIQLGLSQFELGPHEAVRMVFNVDPTRLPRGGVYAAIFFQTTPIAGSSQQSYIVESANIGTLLMLNNGRPGQHVGGVTKLDAPWFQSGGELTGSLVYHNTDQSHEPVGFRPTLGAQAVPWSKPHTFATGLLLPGSSRQFSFRLPGSYFGPLPLTVIDHDSGRPTTRWIFAFTGYYRYLIPLLVVMLGLVIALRRQWAPTARWLKKHFRRRRRTMRRPMDGIGPKSHP